MVPQRTSRRQDGPMALRPKSSLPASRPAKDAPKPKPSVSTSAILKRKPMKEVYSKKDRRHKRSLPPHELALDFQENIEESSAALTESAFQSLTEAHNQFSNKLDKVAKENEDFTAKVQDTTKLLSSSISDERVETVFTRGDKRVTEILKIGERMVKFTKLLDTKERELEEYWTQWSLVQQELIELGVEVLGPESFKGDVSLRIGGRGGFKHEKHLLDVEHRVRTEEMEEDIDTLGQDMKDKMTAAEKELDANLKKEQAKIFAALLQD